jgi:hypothetical protein
LHRGNAASLSSIPPSEYGGEHFRPLWNHLSPYTHLDLIHGRFIPQLSSLSFCELRETASGKEETSGGNMSPLACDVAPVQSPVATMRCLASAISFWSCFEYTNSCPIVCPG